MEFGTKLIKLFQNQTFVPHMRRHRIQRHNHSSHPSSTIDSYSFTLVSDTQEQMSEQIQRSLALEIPSSPHGTLFWYTWSSTPLLSSSCCIRILTKDKIQIKVMVLEQQTKEQVDSIVNGRVVSNTIYQPNILAHLFGTRNRRGLLQQPQLQMEEVQSILTQLQEEVMEILNGSQVLYSMA